MISGLLSLSLDYGGSFYELIYVEIAMFVSVMKVDAYYVPRSYILVMNQACL